MNAETTLGKGPQHRHRSLPRVRVDPQDESDRAPLPAPAKRFIEHARPRTRNPDPESPEMGNLAASFPLFFFGAGCLAAATFAVLEGGGASIGRIPLWLPFLALGIIALVGGTLSVFAEPDNPSVVALVERSPSTPAMPVVESADLARPGPRHSPDADSLHETTPTPPARARPTWAPRAEVPAEPQEVARPRPQRNPANMRGMSFSPPPSPSLEVSAAPTVSDDAGALLQELDRIEADLHSAQAAGEVRSEAASPQAARASPAGRSSARTSLVESLGEPSVRPSPAILDELESESPRKIATCGGCGSVIIDEGQIPQCRVCGEPLCSECRERSRAEGTPNVCPLCSLLGTMHSGGPAAARATVQRT